MTLEYHNITGAHVLWLLANSEDPLTPQQITERLDGEQKSIHDTVMRCWRSGLLVRRERYEIGDGKNPYEYAIARREGDNERS